MGDRLTDEQVAEMWAKAERYALYRRGRECWEQALKDNGFNVDVYVRMLPEQYEAVRSRAIELKTERGLMAVSCFPEDRDPTWADVAPLLAEVRRARGME